MLLRGASLLPFVRRHRPGGPRVPRVAPRFDRRRDRPPSLSYAVCSIPRSGSSLLAAALWESGLAGLPTEYFNERHYPRLLARWQCLRGVRRSLRWLAPVVSPLRASPATLHAYLAALPRWRTGDNGVFGFKIHHGQWRAELAPRPLHTLFPGLGYVAIRRRDRLRQAISFVRALQSERWVAHQRELIPPRYSHRAIAGAVGEIERQEQGWERYFETYGIEPVRVTYESLAADYEGTVFGVLDALGIERPAEMRLPPPRLRRQADELTDAWVERFERERAAAGQPLAGSR